MLVLGEFSKSIKKRKMYQPRRSMVQVNLIYGLTFNMIIMGCAIMNYRSFNFYVYFNVPSRVPRFRRFSLVKYPRYI